MLNWSKGFFQRNGLSSGQPSREFTRSSPETDRTARSLQPRMRTCQISGSERQRRDRLLTLCSQPAEPGSPLLPDPGCQTRPRRCLAEHPTLLLGVVAELGSSRDARILLREDARRWDASLAIAVLRLSPGALSLLAA